MKRTIIDGKKIRDEIKESLKREIFDYKKKKLLSLIWVGDNPVIEKFINLKKKFGEDIGITVAIERFKSTIKEEELIEKIKKITQKSDAVVIQLPLPEHLDSERIVNLIPKEKDIDILSDRAFQAFLNHNTKMMPPVVGAINEIFERNSITLENKNIIIIGKGRLVGKPIFLWLIGKHIPPVLLGKGDDIKSSTINADIIISGAGDPNIIKPEMIKKGVVLIDVGTSSDKGVLKGDIDPECKKKASLFSPVPGGIGPITIAKLFENMIL